VTISTTTSGASIRYTTDGSTPSETAGTLYSGPVAVSSSLTLKAIAYESGYADSSVASGSYTIGSGPAWYNTGGTWSHRELITILHGQVSGSANLTNYPMLYSVTDANLAASAQTGGNDILFTAADGVTKLNHEIESYNSTNGKLTAWVQISSLSPTTDTTIYIYYGNGSAGSQQSAAAVWDANYQGVYHFNDNAANTTVVDSTGHANGVNSVGNNSGNNTTQNTSVTAAPAEVAGGVSYTTNVAGGDYMVAPVNGNAYTAATAEFWVNPNGTPSTTAGLFQWANFLGAGSAFILAQQDTNGNLKVYDGAWSPGVPLANSAWSHVAITWASGGSFTLYLNGVLQSSQAAGTNPSSSANIYLANAYNGAYQGGYLSGKMDEARFSNAVRSADWILTEYRNENSPGTFFTVGGQQ
jgi:MSHA biogenesis protein MshQ